jgi:hypothetical protein
MSTWPSRHSTPFKEFEELCESIQQRTDESFWLKHKTEITGLPLRLWKNRIDAESSNAHLLDSTSVAAYVAQFNMIYKTTATKKDSFKDHVMMCAVNDSDMSPNNFQKAVAQINLSLLKVYQK